MTKNIANELSSVSFRLAPAQIQQLGLLSRIYGGQTRVLVVALDRLYQDALRTNPAFVELVAGEPAAAAEVEADAAAGE